MLTNLTKTKEYLKIPASDTADDNILNRMIQVADEFVKKYTGRKLEATDLIEYYSTHSGQTILILNEYPVNSIASIYDDPDRVYAQESLINPANYIFEGSMGIVRLDGVYFNEGLNNVKVVYNAGYSSVPYDLEQAVLEIIAQKYHSYDKIRQGIQSRSFEGESVQFFIGELFPDTKAVLDRYKKWR